MVKNISSLIEQCRYLSMNGSANRLERGTFKEAADALDALSQRKDAVGGGIAGMVAWPSDDIPPEDWDGEDVLCSDGKMRGGCGLLLGNIGADIIAYTPKAPASSNDGAARERLREAEKPIKTFYQGFYHSGSVACWLGYETTDMDKILEWVKLHVSAGRAVSVQIQERII